MWARVVWLEGQKEIEGVVPEKWVRDGFICWPPGVSAEKSMREMRDPASSWRKFKMVKMKIRSGTAS